MSICASSLSPVGCCCFISALIVRFQRFKNKKPWYVESYSLPNGKLNKGNPANDGERNWKRCHFMSGCFPLSADFFKSLHFLNLFRTNWAHLDRLRVWRLTDLFWQKKAIKKIKAHSNGSGISQKFTWQSFTVLCTGLC